MVAEEQSNIALILCRCGNCGQQVRYVIMYVFFDLKQYKSIKQFRLG